MILKLKRDFLKIIVFGILLGSIIMSCKKNEKFEQIQDTIPSILVHKVTDYNDKILGEFEYDSSFKLQKCYYDNPTGDWSSEMKFYYSDNRVYKIDYYYNGSKTSNRQKIIKYKDDRVVRIEDYSGEQNLSHVNINYNSFELVESLNKDENSPMSKYEYDESGNMIKSYHYYKDEFTGENKTQICEYEFDTLKQPSFGLDYLVGIEIFPWGETTSGWTRFLSENNLVKDNNSKHEYSFEYNKDGFPTQIIINWGTIETETPIMKKIEYLRINDK